jgi:hypothetical protein
MGPRTSASLSLHSRPRVPQHSAPAQVVEGPPSNTNIIINFCLVMEIKGCEVMCMVLDCNAEKPIIIYIFSQYISCAVTLYNK